MILEVKNGSFSYGQREILRNISFCLEEQKIMTILGPNGVGKTTLLKCIMGFLPWNRGEARILEKNLNAYSDKELWKQISYVPQAKRSAFSYGVLEMVVMGLDKENSFFYTPKKDHFDRANEMLKELGVGKLAGRYCNELSGGELQMVMLARALVSGPKLLILDEPTAGLDPKGRDDILGLVQKLHNEQGLTIILVSHSMEDVARYADRLIVMNHGQKVFDGAPKEVFCHYRELETMGLAAPQITYLVHDLKAQGIDIDDDITTVAEAREAILALRNKLTESSRDKNV